MYIMCVCLFSALSRRVGALQISIIKKKKAVVIKTSRHGTKKAVGGRDCLSRLDYDRCWFSARTQGTCLKRHAHLLVGRVAERQVGLFERHPVLAGVGRDEDADGVGLWKPGTAPAQEWRTGKSIQLVAVAGEGVVHLGNAVERVLEEVFHSVIVSVYDHHSSLT